LSSEFESLIGEDPTRGWSDDQLRARLADVSLIERIESRIDRAAHAFRRRTRIGATAGFIVAACAGTAAALLAPTQGEGPTPLVLLAKPYVQVISEAGANGCTKVYLSTDFRHFHSITPMVPTRRGYAPTCNWSDATFLSARDGWLVGLNSGGGPSVLEHTTDGGRNWSLQHPQSAEGSEAAVIGFSNARDGWDQLIASNANVFALQRTTTSGSSWELVQSTGGCPWVPVVFPTPSIGVAARGLTTVWESEDGGERWRALRLPVPRDVPPSAPAIFDAPVFEGLRGTLPVIYLEAQQTVIAFDTTVNGGRTWHVAGVSRFQQRISITSRTPFGTCMASLPETSAPLPLLSGATPSSWWILQRGPADRSIVTTVKLGPNGVTTVGHLSWGLPATLGALQLTLNAADATHAYVGVGNGREVAYQTANGGGR